MKKISSIFSKGLVLACALTLLGSGVAFAQKSGGVTTTTPSTPSTTTTANITTGSDAQAINRIAGNYGSSELSTDSYGDPFITGVIDGYNYSITFFGCDDNNTACTELLFRAWWEGSQGMNNDKINQYNADSFFGKAYIDFEGDLTLEMCVNIRYGIVTETLDDSFDWWRIELNDLASQI